MARFPLLLLLAAHLLAQATPPASAQEGSPDRVRLATGWVLEGRILRDEGGILEIQLAEGAVLGLGRGQVLEVVRGGAGATEQEAAEAPETAVPPPDRARARDQWFLLHGTDGLSLGTVHVTVRAEAADDGAVGVRLEEVWNFSAGDRHHALTRIERATADLEPLDFFFREVATDAATGRTVHEKIVRGALEDGGLLELEILSPAGRVRRQLRSVDDVRFPLAKAERLRRRRGPPERIEATLFDPIAETFVRRAFTAGGQRRVMEGGDRPAVYHVVASQRWGGTHEEWLDGEGRIRRFEVNGPWLVAAACTPEEAARAAEARVAAAPPRVRADRTGRLTAVLPHPGWRFRGVEGTEGIEMEEPVLGLQARAWLLDQLDPEATAAAALGAAVRTFGHLHPDLREALGPWPPDVLEGTFSAREEGEGGRVRTYRARARVVGAPGRFAVLWAWAPLERYHEAEPDLARLPSLLDVRPPPPPDPVR